jgi:hypothetical protein
MFKSRNILIADGSIYAALALSEAVEASDGVVLGPVCGLSDAQALLGSHDVRGAIVDCDLVDAPALILHLVGAGVPAVVQTSLPLPTALEALDGRLPVLMRPVDPRTVIDTLVREIDRTEQPAESRSGPVLGPGPSTIG